MTEKKKKKTSIKDSGQKKQKFWLGTLREGRPLSVDFFKRHAWFILIAMVAVIALIGQRYTNKSKMREIKSLDKELAFERSQQLNEKALYMSLIRENAMRDLLRKKNLDLDYQEQPPFELHRN